MDHGIVASRVLHTWTVPLILTDAINWHHAPMMAPSGRLETGLLAAANMLDNTGYTPGMEIGPEIMALLPKGVDSEILAKELSIKIAKDRASTLAGMV
jgi:hypothetical protein